MLVNGRERPTVKVPRGVRQRWRIINAARSRFFQLEVAGHALTRIGGDGGLLEAPAAAVDRLLLVPGERAEVSVVLMAAAGERLAVRALAHARGGDRVPSQLDIMYLDLIDGGPTPASTLPTRLRSIERLEPSAGVAEQSIRIGSGRRAS